MEDIGLFRQAWMWLESQKQAFVGTQVAVGCMKDMLIFLVDQHWQLELDEIFRRNHWILPKYCVFPSPDNIKFRSVITVKGLDFEHSLRGDPKDDPDQARESAAASMLTKLQEMGAEAHRG